MGDTPIRNLTPKTNIYGVLGRDGVHQGVPQFLTSISINLDTLGTLLDLILEGLFKNLT